MAKYKVFLRPISNTYYEYEIETQFVEKAEEVAFDLLRDAIGWDAAKDWECYDIVEERDNG
tara:strand:+ start:134 stop:316 length:183 start_codon:yes stop_codon:yes gene_type:complete